MAHGHYFSSTSKKKNDCIDENNQRAFVSFASSRRCSGEWTGQYKSFAFKAFPKNKLLTKQSLN